MRLTRLYTGSDNASYFEDLGEMELKELGKNAGKISAPIKIHGVTLQASSVVVYTFDSGMFMDWHTPLIGRFIEIFIEGQEEIEVESGEKRIFGKGDIVVFENLKGKGHRARSLKPGYSLILQ